ncbi:TIGR04211 family SH3 domain-containing protein [Patescibacteria group bacterium]|nr:TIGR04211 family SH3 domain-containing protein [Patescibacteria group bacterium]
MRRFLFIGVLLVLFSTTVRAETQYVSDLAEITLRTGKGIDHKIITMLKSGVQVEVLEPNDQWTKIRLPDGREGWVMSRFLTPKMPNSLELEELKKKHEALLAMADTPFKEIQKLQEENERLRSELAVAEKALNSLKGSYESLKKESPELLKLKSDYQRLEDQFAKQKKRAGQLEDELSKHDIRQHVRWFLSGAAVLLVGFFLGFSAKRQRRRSSLLS